MTPAPSTLARFRNFCIDAVDPQTETRFWGELLGLESHVVDGVGEIRTPSGDVLVRVTGTAEPKSAKNRVHLDVYAESVQQVVDLGATVVATYPRWTTLLDPDGQELCVFVRDEPIGQRLYEVGWDCAEGMEASHARATWWQGVLGGDVFDHEEHGFSWLESIPGAPFESIDFAGVPEPKTAPNRVRLELRTDDLDALVAHGAMLLGSAAGPGRHLLADPDGNEFYAVVEA